MSLGQVGGMGGEVENARSSSLEEVCRLYGQHLTVEYRVYFCVKMVKDTSHIKVSQTWRHFLPPSKHRRHRSALPLRKTRASSAKPRPSKTFFCPASSVSPIYLDLQYLVLMQLIRHTKYFQLCIGCWFHLES